MPGNHKRIVWITGAGKGIGRAIALKCAANGDSVAASARTEQDLLDLAAEAGNLPGLITPYPLDITDAEQVAETVAAIEDDVGPIDCAILNAGTHVPTPLSAFEPETVRNLFEVNVMGTVHCLAALTATREDRRGSAIAVVASLAGYRGLPQAAGYGATKAALINMCEALKPELDPFGIRLHLINPGFVRTPLTDKNDFPMPFLISAEAAAQRVLDGLRGDRFETAFPRRFAFIMKTLRILPDWLFFSITRRLLR